MVNEKVVHTIILDAGPILRDDPSISTLLAQSEELLTTPSVLSEIKDQDARSRVELTLRPFLDIRTPSPASVKVITEFAKKTGDYAVLSSPDIQVLSLAYEVECERNGGDWRLRKVPGQKRINGPAPNKKNSAAQNHPTDKEAVVEQSTPSDSRVVTGSYAEEKEGLADANDGLSYGSPCSAGILSAADAIDQLKITTSDHPGNTNSLMEKLKEVDASEPISEELEGDSSGSEGWITPSNLKRHLTKDAGSATEPIKPDTTLQVAVLTTDFAMQNVLLSMGLNLISPLMQQVRHIRAYILRCHACFQQTKDMTKQFCPRCGKPTLTRVSCSTNQNGKTVIHLKKNMHWNHRGDRFSIPKPVPGTAHGKTGVSKGGGKGGWGRELILAEDQKEYVRAVQERSRGKTLDLMDQDYLPGILTGRRGREGDRITVGGGRNINARKR